MSNRVNKHKASLSSHHEEWNSREALPMAMISHFKLILKLTSMTTSAVQALPSCSFLPALHIDGWGVAEIYYKNLSKTQTKPPTFWKYMDLASRYSSKEKAVMCLLGIYSDYDCKTTLQATWSHPIKPILST